MKALKTWQKVQQTRVPRRPAALMIDLAGVNEFLEQRLIYPPSGKMICAVSQQMGICDPTIGRPLGNRVLHHQEYSLQFTTIAALEVEVASINGKIDQMRQLLNN